MSAVLDGAPLACPIEEAIWTDWVTQQVKDAQIDFPDCIGVVSNLVFGRAQV